MRKKLNKQTEELGIFQALKGLYNGNETTDWTRSQWPESLTCSQFPGSEILMILGRHLWLLGL